MVPDRPDSVGLRARCRKFSLVHFKNSNIKNCYVFFEGRVTEIQKTRTATKTRVLDGLIVPGVPESPGELYPSIFASIHLMSF